MLAAPSLPIAFLFVNPWTALAAAAGAAAIPIIIHLLNRKRFRIVQWAAMRFLLAAQRQNVRRMRLEQLLLLAVRTSLVLLLVLAMASVMPWAEEFWQRLFPGSAARAALGSQRTHKILVLDGSFSMALKVNETSCFEMARERAAQILERSPSGDGYSVILMAAPPQRIVPEPSDDARKVGEEIKSLRLPHGNADLLATLNAVEDMLRRSPAKYDAREVYFLTDMQRSTWLTGRGAELTELLQRIQTRATVIFTDVGTEGVTNLAVTNLALGTSLATTGTVTPVLATIHNYGGDERKQVRVELLVGKARAASTEPPFALRVVHQQIVAVPPGRNGVSVAFPYKFRTPGDYVIQVRLENDALEVDDSRTVVLSVKDSVPVMLVNGKPAVEVYDRATEWLRDALNPFQAGLVPRNIPARPKVVTETQFSDANLGDLTPFDCVYLCDVPRLGTREVQRLETHLRRGGGVVFCLGPRIDLEAYNRLIYRNGDGILPGRLLGFQRAPENRSFTFYAEEDSYKRPPLDAFAGDLERTSLQLSRFRQYTRVEMPQRRARKVLSFMPAALLAKGPKLDVKDAEPLPVGDPAVIEWQPLLAPAAADAPNKTPLPARGRVVLITTTVNMDWTTWPISPSYPPLMQEMLRFAVAGRLREQAALVGDTLEEFLQGGHAGLEVAITTPDNRTVEARTQAYEDACLLQFAETDQSGIYRAQIGQHPREYLFAVNVPTATEAQLACESDLARTNKVELESNYPGSEFQIVTDLKDVAHAGGAAALPGDGSGRGIGALVARVLLWVVFVLLLVEVVLAWIFGHFSTSAAPSETPPSSSRRGPIAVAAAAGVAFVLLAGVLLHAAKYDDFLGFLPDRLRAGVEWLLDVPQPVAGEGTRWRLEYTSYLLRNPAIDPWLIGCLVAGAVALVVFIYKREGSTAGAAFKVLLTGLRVFVVLLMLAVLLPQLRLWFERQGWPDLAIVIDDSRSMSAVDRYRDPRVRETAERLAQVANLTEPQRLQLAQVLLTRNDGDWLEALVTQRKVKVHVYHCSARAARLADVSEPAERSAANQAIQDLQAEGESSQLGAAIRQVLNDFRGSSLSALIMLTDGVTTEGEDLSSAARYAKQMGVPLYFVGVGDAHEVRDLVLHDLQVDDSVFVNDRLIFEARLTGQGYTALTVPVTLYEKTKDGKLKELAREMVPVDPQGKPVKFRMTHKPAEAGEKVYILDVPVQPDEAQPADNNRLERTVLVRDAKMIKVLYVEGYPRYEFRYIKSLLERESADDPKNKSIDLKVLLLDADDDYAAQDKSAKADFPAKAELNQYDVVILGDVDPKHPKMGDKNVQNLADFVRERGGGLLMIAGDQNGPHAYQNSPLKDVLPVLAVGEAPLDRDLVEGYRPQLTPVGKLHPIFRFSADEAENSAIWERLAELFWWGEGYRTQPAAEVLAVHPHRSGLDPRRPGGISEEKHPLVAQQFVGAGRCMFFGMDETWRWRFREDEIRFNQFWIQTVRYLARSRLGRTELRLDRQLPYRRGQPIKVIVRFPDDSPPPGAGSEVKVVVERKAPRTANGPAETEVQTLQLVKVEGSRATYEALLTRTPEGEYRFWLSTPPVAGLKPRAECRVLPPPGEMERLRMNQPDLERAAEESHGKFYTLADADKLLDDLPAGTRVSLNTPRPPWLLWNHMAMFGLVMFLLSSEWLLRKQKHLL